MLEDLIISRLIHCIHYKLKLEILNGNYLLGGLSDLALLHLGLITCTLALICIDQS